MQQARIHNSCDRTHAYIHVCVHPRTHPHKHLTSSLAHGHFVSQQLNVTVLVNRLN
uniref:Uncharacterized protein n=1 Tax=Anguilla anguilla TaxID=7936 RepID=A0A0E9WH13_ANGAN